MFASIFTCFLAVFAGLMCKRALLYKYNAMQHQILISNTTLDTFTVNITVYFSLEYKIKWYIYMYVREMYTHTHIHVTYIP